MPQDINGWWHAARAQNVFQTFSAYYPKIDKTRIYLTGYSAGGGGVWDYSGNVRLMEGGGKWKICIGWNA